ncbi:hypothetical protein EAE99_007297 [Botrytis elliptica]|nr:hypothetical protein EAE99_007297 [Botrytis elliptica]
MNFSFTRMVLHVSWWGCIYRRESYEWVMRVLGLDPEECGMVAVYTSDLEGARKVFCKRWTDDINRDQEVIKCENDAYLKDIEDLGKVIREL